MSTEQDKTLNSAQTQSPQDLVLFLREYARDRINSRLFDARRSLPPSLVLDFGRQGLLGLRTPRRYGGLELGYRASMPVMEQLAAIDLSIAMLVGIHNGLGIAPVLLCGTQQAKDELLPLLATGRMLGGLAITEPGAGSDPRAIAGTAHYLANGSWRLNAEKIWVGNGAWAGLVNVFVRRQGEGQRAGLAGFAVKAGSRGFKVGAEAMTMGMRSIVQSRITLSDVEVEAPYALDMEGPTDSLFHLARFGLAIFSCGALKRCAQLMLRYATRRAISTGLLADNPVFRVALASTLHSIRALERLCVHVADEVDAGRPVAAELFMICKISGPEYLGCAADRLIQFLGGRGYIDANEAPQLLRDARLLRIAEGPTETLRTHLGSMWRTGSPDLRALLSQNGNRAKILAAIDAACDEIWRMPRPAGSTVGQHSFARYAAIGEVVAEGVMWWFASAGAADAGLQTWAGNRFDDAVTRAMRSAGADIGFDFTEIENELALSIGNIVQTLPGEEWELDSSLFPSS